MPFEYFLEPTNSTMTFSQEVLVEMHNYLKDLPSYIWNNSTYVIFETPEDRDRRVPQLLSKVDSGENDYLDPNIDLYLYNFVLWCQEHWDCELYYGAKPVSPEDMLSEP